MERIHSRFTMQTQLSFLLLLLLQTATEANICSVPSIDVEFDEGNALNAVVTTITIEDGVTLEFKPPPANPDSPFTLDINTLRAARVLDYEGTKNYVVELLCTQGSLKVSLTIIVILRNKNDNAPTFPVYPDPVLVNEMSPVGTLVGNFPASDLDGDVDLSYRLVSDPNDFELRNPNSADVITRTVLDYDKIKNARLILYVQDVPLLPGDSVHTASTTIQLAIRDVDNRPPWLQPCIKYEAGMTVICQGSGYTGNVVLNEQEDGPLPLKPGPLYAIDGDSGIGEAITYSFLSGNEDGLFAINPNTGNITMVKAADVANNITLTVLAAQTPNSNQFATTTVKIYVQVKSLHEPRFEKSLYEGYVTAVGTMVKDMKNPDELLKITALDEDYAAAGGINPHITYSIIGSTSFSIIDNFVFMTEDLPQGPLTLQVKAVDTTNDQSATTQLKVEVGQGPTTTVLPLSTSDTMTTTSIEEFTTNTKTTEDIVSTEDSSFTTYPTSTSGESLSTASTAQVIPLTGMFGPEDMAAVGATLGGLLLICLVVIGVLAHRVKIGKADWRKIYDASLFRSSLGKDSGSHKEGIQYTNEAFQDDDDGGSVGSGGPQGGSSATGGDPQKATTDIPPNEPIRRSLMPLNALLDDNVSQTSSDKADTEKEVKPILTKERRMEEGYKAVWFKEDIDPNAKEEVVIIPDSREDDSEEENEGSVGGREEKDDDTPKRTSKVGFADTDMDSGLGVKIEDPAEDSDDYDQVLTSDL